MLRCVLEGYTYMKTVYGEKLLGEWKFPEDTTIKASPFVSEWCATSGSDGKSKVSETINEGT